MALVATAPPAQSHRSRDFRLLWSGETVSQVGSQLTVFALPTLAIRGLHATTLQVGILTALDNVPTALLALFAGVWVDRMRRRPLLIAADLGQALALAAVTVLALTHALGIDDLYAAALLTGALGVVFTVAYQSYVPDLVTREHLLAANTRLEVSTSGAQLIGPAASGLLIGALRAAGAIALDAGSFVVSAFGIAMLRTPERPPAASPPEPLARRIGEGLSFVYRQPILRNLMFASAGGNLGFSITWTVVLVYLYRQLGFSPASAGLVFTVTGAAFVFSLALRSHISTRLGIGWTLVVASVLTGLGLGGIAVATQGDRLVALIPPLALLNFSLPLYNVASRSLRQTLTPTHLQGRVNATINAVTWGINPIGSLLAGLLGGLLGLRLTIAIGGAISVLAAGPLLSHAVRTVWSLEGLPDADALREAVNDR